jgi:hypothetical protein
MVRLLRRVWLAADEWFDCLTRVVGESSQPTTALFQSANFAESMRRVEQETRTIEEDAEGMEEDLRDGVDFLQIDGLVSSDGE